MLSGYKIYYKEGSTPQTGLISSQNYSLIVLRDTSGNLSHTINGVTAGNSYLIHVRAFSEQSNNIELLGDVNREVLVETNTMRTVVNTDINGNPINILDYTSTSISSISTVLPSVQAFANATGITRVM